MQRNEFDIFMISNLTKEIKRLEGVIGTLQETNEKLKQEAYESRSDVKDLSSGFPIGALKRCDNCGRFKLSMKECTHCGYETEEKNEEKEKCIV